MKSDTIFNHYKNKNEFHSKVELSVELIGFAHKHKDNPAAARAILHSVSYLIHDLRNIYSVLLGQYELNLLKEVHNEHPEPVRPGERNSLRRKEGAAIAATDQ